MVGSMVQYLAGTKMRTQPGAPTQSKYPNHQAIEVPAGQKLTPDKLTESYINCVILACHVQLRILILATLPLFLVLLFLTACLCFNWTYYNSNLMHISWRSILVSKFNPCLKTPRCPKLWTYM